MAKRKAPQDIVSTASLPTNAPIEGQTTHESPTYIDLQSNVRPKGDSSTDSHINGISDWLEPGSLSDVPLEIIQSTTAIQNAQDTPQQAQGEQAHDTQPGGEQQQGEVSTALLEAEDSPGAHARGQPEGRMAAKVRWTREGRLPEIEAWMQEKRSDLRDTGMVRHRANDAAWEAAIREFPAPGQDPASIPPVADPMGSLAGPTDDRAEVSGVYLVPEAWPPLSDNASLQAELGWVQAQRLRIVETKGNVTTVHLEKASTPAPSWAALSWLETSIRSYAKYIDIVSRVLTGQQDEAEAMRRDRMQVDEIRALLRQMHDGPR